MPGGEDHSSLPASSSTSHTTPGNIPVASVSPRRTPTRCQTSRGVVGVGVGVAHLSEATRERLAAASHHQQQQQQQQQQHMSYIESPTMSQHYIRQRRLSGRESQGFSQPPTFNNVDYSSLGKLKSGGIGSSTTTTTATASTSSNCGFNSGFGNVPMGSSSSSSSSSTSMRYANSLDSLDAVTNSIQQARANSFNNTNLSQWYQTGQANSATQPIYPTCVSRRETGDESRSLTYRDPSHVMPSRSFQRTFPLRKSTGSTSRASATPSSSVTTTTTATQGSLVIYNDSSDNEAKCEPIKQTPNRSWRQSADELTEIGGLSAAFWLSPCRSSSLRGNVTSSTATGVELDSSQYVTTFNENGIRTQTKLNSTDAVATVSPFRTSRASNRTSSLTGQVCDAETQRLRRELQQEQERVQRLSAQLSTNSHVVSAFEHSLANMTDRLTKLTSTSEKKDKELSELRQIIQHLKETSELKGFPAPLRWRSDENVLSGSYNNKQRINGSSHGINGSESDNEGINNNNNKHDNGATIGMWRNKKQKWFRSSLTKAFGRHRHKSTGGSNSSISSKENSSKNPKDQNFSTQISHQRSVSVSALDDPFVADLQRQLAVKDDLLTETRLEALSSASQLQTLRETVAKLRSELKSVQRENEDLRHRLVSSSSSSNINSVEPGSTAIDDDKVPSSLFANMSVDRGSRDGLRIDVPVIVRIQASPQEINVRIGYVRMSRRQDWTDSKKWRELDMNVQCVFGLYMARLDPFDRLGLSAEASIERYSFMGRSRQPLHVESTECFNDESEKRETPILKSRQIHLTLRSRGPSDQTRHSMVLDELSFATLRPKCLFQTFTENLLRTRMGLLLGPRGCGKRFTAQRLAELLTKENSHPSESDICKISFNNVSGGGVDNDEQLLLEEFERSVAASRGVSLVAILEDLDSETSSSPLLTRSLLPRMRRLIEANYTTSVYILITASSRRGDIMSDSSLSLATLSLSQTDCRMEKSHIGYVLRQKVIDLETETQEANDAMVVAVNWLNRLCIHFDEFCQRIDPEIHFSPKPFNQPVLDNTHKFRTWFLDLWNTVIAQTLREVVQTAQSRGSQLSDFEDPVRFVFRTWPWREDVAGLPQALRPVIGQGGPDSGSGSVNPRSRFKTTDHGGFVKNDDPLLDMLLCLQEATKESADDKK